jgi:hypothetical protein
VSWEIRQGDALERLREMPDESVQCCVTSPPYWGLRDYGVDGQLGLEQTPAEFVAAMVELERLDFEEFRGVPIRGDDEMPTGRFRLVCSGQHGAGDPVDAIAEHREVAA